LKAISQKYSATAERRRIPREANDKLFPFCL